MSLSYISLISNIQAATHKYYNLKNVLFIFYWDIMLLDWGIQHKVQYLLNLQKDHHTQELKLVSCIAGRFFTIWTTKEAA